MKPTSLIFNKNAEKATFCPKCGNEMDKIALNRHDIRLNRITLGILKAERFLCFGCFWAEKRFNGIKSKRNAINLIRLCS